MGGEGGGVRLMQDRTHLRHILPEEAPVLAKRWRQLIYDVFGFGCWGEILVSLVLLYTRVWAACPFFFFFKYMCCAYDTEDRERVLGVSTISNSWQITLIFSFYIYRVPRVFGPPTDIPLCLDVHLGAYLPACLAV